MTTEQKRARARKLRGQEPPKTIREIADDLDVSINTAHRYVNPAAEERQLLRNRERRRRERQAEEESTTA
jgi:transposase